MRGFAVVHCIGILTSMFSAVFFSRGLVNLWYGRQKKLKSVSIGTIWRAAPEGAPAVASDGGAVMKGTLGALTILTFVIGVYSAPVVNASGRAAAELFAPDAYIGVVLGRSAQADAGGVEGPGARP